MIEVKRCKFWMLLFHKSGGAEEMFLLLILPQSNNLLCEAQQGQAEHA